jgi:cytochrome c553
MKTVVLLGLFIAVTVVHAQSHPIFKDADVAQGEALMAQHACESCHIRREGGDGSSIYKPQGRINSAGALRGMVEYCNTELNLGMFPEETTDVAAALNKRHYKFR